MGHIANTLRLSMLAVRRRPKLARVSPKIVALLPTSGITQVQPMALAIFDSHAEHEHVWIGTAYYRRSPSQLRAAHDSRRNRYEGDDPVECFVGVDANEAAGGAVRRAPFSNNCEGYLADAAS